VVIHDRRTNFSFFETSAAAFPKAILVQLPSEGPHAAVLVVLWKKYQNYEETRRK
jgi:hypothetical protein